MLRKPNGPVDMVCRGIYTNAAYGESEITLEIDIDAGVGQINLEVDDPSATETE